MNEHDRKEREEILKELLGTYTDFWIGAALGVLAGGSISLALIILIEVVT